jgi:hypothetical protein
MGPLLHWKKEPVRDKAKALAPVAETNTLYVPPPRITPDNIASLILEKIASEGASGVIMDAAVELSQDLFGTAPEVHPVVRDYLSENTELETARQARSF